MAKIVTKVEVLGGQMATIAAADKVLVFTYDDGSTSQKSYNTLVKWLTETAAQQAVLIARQAILTADKTAALTQIPGLNS